MAKIALTTIAMTCFAVATIGYAADAHGCANEPAGAMQQRPSNVDTGGRPLAQSGRPIPDYPIPPTVDVNLQGAVHGFVLPEHPNPSTVEVAAKPCSERDQPEQGSIGVVQHR